MIEYPSPVSVSRRDFLKLCSLATAGFFLPFPNHIASNPDEKYGRVIYTSVDIYTQPAFDSEKLNVHWKDSVIPISAVTIGTDPTAYNRVWYRIGEEGFAYSGGIQPVRIQLNQPVFDIPIQGNLAEVTVPFTDAHWKPGKTRPVAYRFYYETTHWVTGTAPDEQGNPWYKVLDDKWEFSYYVPAEHLRLIPPDELTPLSPEVPFSQKRIEVQTGKQYVVAYEYDQPVFMARTATGARFSNGDFSTPIGEHMVIYKRPYRHMAAGNLAANGFDLPGVSWVSYFTERGVSFHGTYWHNDYGRPRSHGCVNLTAKAAKWIFLWTLPVVPYYLQSVYKGFGTRVDVI